MLHFGEHDRQYSAERGRARARRHFPQGDYHLYPADHAFANEDRPDTTTRRRRRWRVRAPMPFWPRTSADGRPRERTSRDAGADAPPSCWSTPVRRRRRTTAAVGRFLRRFLSDPRVIELPRVLWLPLLYGLVLPLRAPRSAHKYRRSGSDEGSPLLLHTSQLREALAARTGRAARRLPRRTGVPVFAALRARDARRAARGRRAAPAGAAAVSAEQRQHHRRGLRSGGRRRCARWRALPELRYIASYHAEPDYIERAGRQPRAITGVCTAAAAIC